MIISKQLLLKNKNCAKVFKLAKGMTEEDKMRLTKIFVTLDRMNNTEFINFWNYMRTMRLKFVDIPKIPKSN